MKTAKFFLEKSNEYLESLNEILPKIDDYKSFEQTEEQELLKKSTDDLKFKIKLMFSEFDNGNLFVNKATAIDEDRQLMFKNESRLIKYKDLLTLFSEHITEYRN